MIFVKNGLGIHNKSIYRYYIHSGNINYKKGSNMFLNFLRKYKVFNNKHIPTDLYDEFKGKSVKNIGWIG